MSSDNPARGAVLLVISALIFAAMAAIIKRVSADLPNEMVVFVRNALGLAVLLPWAARGGVRRLATDRFSMHLTRSLAGLTGMYCFFYSIGHLPLAEAMLLNYSAPLFIPFIARFWLAEPLPRGVGVPVALGFGGIALILKPGLSLLSPAAFAGLAAGVFTAVAFVSIRRLAQREPAERIVFYFGVVSTLVSAIPLAWAWRTPAPVLWGLLVAVGVLATAGQLLLTRAYALAPAARIGPFSYATVVFSAIFGWLFFGELLDRLSIAGATLVVAAGVLAVRLRGAPAAPVGEEPVSVARTA